MLLSGSRHGRSLSQEIILCCFLLLALSASARCAPDGQPDGSTSYSANSKPQLLWIGPPILVVLLVFLILLCGEKEPEKQLGDDIEFGAVNLNNSGKNKTAQSKAPEKDPAKENTTAAAGGGFTTASLMNGIQRTLVQPMKENEKLRAVILKNKLELNYKDLQKITEIGHGAMGVVFKATFKGQVVAVKEFDSSCDAKDLNREIGILATMPHHPNIVTLIGASLEPAALVTEFVERGSLHEVITKHPDELTPDRAVVILYDVARGMDFLHQQNIMQRDLKSGNILVTEDWHAKITDFGISRPMDDAKVTVLVGTGRWMAPEVHDGKDTYTAKADVYSYAILMWEAYSKRMPFEEHKFDIKVAEFVLKGGRPPIDKMQNPQPWLRELMEKCWAQNPDDRPDFRTVVQEFEKYLELAPTPAPISSARQ